MVFPTSERNEGEERSGPLLSPCLARKTSVPNAHNLDRSSSLRQRGAAKSDAWSLVWVLTSWMRFLAR